MKRFLSTVLVLSAFCSTASAGPCPPGQIQVGQQGAPGAVIPICQPIPGGARSAPAARWKDRWGAIALNPDDNVGATNKEHTRSDAIDTAMRNCASTGADDCRLMTAYVNGCGAVAWGRGDGGHSAWATRPSIGEARIVAVETCEEMVPGDVCEVIHSGCSHPVRIQ